MSAMGSPRVDAVASDQGRCPPELEVHVRAAAREVIPVRVARVAIAVARRCALGDSVRDRNADNFGAG